MFDHYVVVELFPSRLSRVLLFFENYLLAWRPAGKFSHIPVTVLVTVTSALIFFEESCRLTLPSAWEQSIQKTAMPEIDSFTSVWGTLGSAQIQGLRMSGCNVTDRKNVRPYVDLNPFRREGAVVGCTGNFVHDGRDVMGIRSTLSGVEEGLASI
jgi:hypothetical protein